ncbi:MAG: hypothetical protein ACXAEX_07895 [Promethearchaeota archaeon]|jgi:hypothetical protein
MTTLETCAECSEQAISHCVICGKPLCQDHIKHGYSKRTNAPAVNCANCQKKFPRKARKFGIVMAAILIVASILLLIWLMTIIPFGF